MGWRVLILVVQQRGYMAGCFEKGSETWGSIMRGILWLAENCYLLKKDSALWSY